MATESNIMTAEQFMHNLTIELEGVKHDRENLTRQLSEADERVERVRRDCEAWRTKCDELERANNKLHLRLERAERVTDALCGVIENHL